MMVGQTVSSTRHRTRRHICIMLANARSYPVPWPLHAYTQPSLPPSTRLTHRANIWHNPARPLRSGGQLLGVRSVVPFALAPGYDAACGHANVCVRATHFMRWKSAGGHPGFTKAIAFSDGIVIPSTGGRTFSLCPSLSRSHSLSLSAVVRMQIQRGTSMMCVACALCAHSHRYLREFGCRTLITHTYTRTHTHQSACTGNEPPVAAVATLGRKASQHRT